MSYEGFVLQTKCKIVGGIFCRMSQIGQGGPPRNPKNKQHIWPKRALGPNLGPWAPFALGPIRLAGSLSPLDLNLWILWQCPDCMYALQIWDLGHLLAHRTGEPVMSSRVVTVHGTWPYGILSRPSGAAKSLFTLPGSRATRESPGCPGAEGGRQIKHLRHSMSLLGGNSIGPSLCKQ